MGLIGFDAGGRPRPNLDRGPKEHGRRAPAPKRSAAKSKSEPAPRKVLGNFVRNNPAPAPAQSQYHSTAVADRPAAPAQPAPPPPPAQDFRTLLSPPTTDRPQQNPLQAENPPPAPEPAKTTPQDYGAPPPPSDGVRELLNKQNWKQPKKAKPVDMPDSAFEKGSIHELKQHDYTVSAEEWDRLKATYGSEGAAAQGYSPPPEASVDKNMPLMHLGKEESAALTWDAYEKLSSDQRAAVDFNTLLVDAREKDLKKPISLMGDKRATYNTEVDQLFGAGRGSDTVAPATVDLLSKLDMKLVGQDLDEYLSLERGIDTTELGKFKFSKGDVKTIDTLVNGAAPTYADVRSPGNLANLDTTVIQNTQQLIKSTLANPASLPYDFDSLMHGPTTQQQKDDALPPMGFGTDTTKWTSEDDRRQDEWFRKAISTLGSPDPTQYGAPNEASTMDWLLSDLDTATGGDKKVKQQFLDYVQGQASLFGQYGSQQDATIAAMITKRAGLGG